MATIKTKKGTELPLMKLQGKDYLQVAHRLVWFREEHPDWGILTEFEKLGEVSFVFTATIKDDAYNTVATAHKMVNMKTSKQRNPLEACETGAIGRALAMCGYGTQFAPGELDEGDEIADAPIQGRYQGARRANA